MMPVRKLAMLIAVCAFAAAGCGTVKNVGGVQGSGSRKTETRAVSGFKKIKAENAVVLEVTVQKDFSVTVEADDNLLQHVRTEVSGDELHIGTRDSITSKSEIRVTVTLPELSALDVSGATAATVDGVKANEFKIGASGASKVRLNGGAAELNADISGASNLDAEAFNAANANVEVSGASTATVNVTGEADLSASGASTIVYVGEPAQLKQDSSGASTIRKR